MHAAADMADRHRELLTELAELGMGVARDLAARTTAAADDAAASQLALAFHRISRSLRQTLALEARLERERKAADRADAQDLARTNLARIQKKRRQVRNALAPLVWTEAEGEEAAEALFEDLEALIWNASEEDDFLDVPIESCIERLRADLGLPTAAANGEAPGEVPGDPPDVVIWKSSG